MSKPGVIKVELPKLPNVEFSLLNTERFCVGTAILSYLTNALRVPVSDDFSALCNQLDEIREQMCIQKEISPNNVHLYIDYFTLLPGLKEHLDVSNRGMNFQFKWESVIFNIVEADLVFFGYNTIISLLRYATHITYKAKSDVQSLIDCLKPCKAIYEKIVPLYQDGFKVVVAFSKIQALLQYIDVYWSYGFLNNTIILKASSVTQGKLSYKYSKQLKLLTPPQSDLSTYFEVFAFAKMYEGYENEDLKDVSIEVKYGQALAYGNHAIELCPKPKQEKKRGSQPTPTPLQILLKPLLDQVQLGVDSLAATNKSIYHQPIPSKAEIPNIDAPPLPPFKWEPKVQPMSYDNDVSQAAQSQIQSKLTEIRKLVSDANDRISSLRSAYPKDKEDEIDAKTARLYAQRKLCQEEEGKLMHMFQTGAGARHPDLQMQFYEMQKFIAKAHETDLYYETKLGTAKSQMVELSNQIRALDSIDSQLQQLLQSFESVSQQSLQVINSTDINQVIYANQNFSQTYENVRAQLAELIAQICDTENRVQQISQGNLQQFNADLVEVGAGFDNGIKCYTDLVQNFSVIAARLMS